jgi:hypothetical protein
LGSNISGRYHQIWMDVRKIIDNQPSLNAAPSHLPFPCASYNPDLDGGPRDNQPSQGSAHHDLSLLQLEPVYFYIHLIMPVARPIVETLAPDSPEYINFLHDSGVTTQLEVRLNKETSKRVVKCDICGVFISLTSNDHPIRFINHRGSDSCKREERRNARKP